MAPTAGDHEDSLDAHRHALWLRTDRDPVEPTLADWISNAAMSGDKVLVDQHDTVGDDCSTV